MREVEFDKNLTNLLNNKFPRKSPSKSSKSGDKEELEEELKLSFEEPRAIDAQYDFDDEDQPKNKFAEEFVPVDEIQTENGRHIIYENKIPLVDIRKKNSKRNRNNNDVQISLGRGDLIDPRDQKGKTFRDLINGINDQQPLGQDDIERMILEKGKVADDPPDAYKDTYLPGQQEPVEEVFEDPMVAAYNALTKNDPEDESEVTESTVKQKLVTAPEPERISKNEKIADFSYPSVVLGKKGLKAQKNFDGETVEKKNILSLIDPNDIVNEYIPKEEETSDEIEDKVDEKDRIKKSKLGPIILPESIGLERCKITGPGGKKELIKEDMKQVDIVQIKSAPKEEPVKTEEIVDDEAKLERLEKAKGQGKPSEIILENPELSILKERKKDRKEKVKPANITEEKVIKQSKDETLIEITAPGAIPNFGKKTKPPTEKQNFGSVFISTDNGQPTEIVNDAMISTLNSLGVLGSNTLETINESAQIGVIDPDINLSEQLGKIGVEGDPNDLEIFPLATGPIADIEIHRTDHMGNTEVKVETLKRDENPREMNQYDLDDYEDEGTSIEKSSKMDAPDVIKGEDSGEPAEKSVEEAEDVDALPTVSPRTFGKPLIPVENISAWEDPDKSIHVNVPNEIVIDDPLEQEPEERDDLGLPIEDKRQTIERIHQSSQSSRAPSNRQSRAPSPPLGGDEFIDPNKYTGKLPLIPPTQKPPKRSFISILYRYFFFFINLSFFVVGCIAIGFGIFGVIKVRLDGLTDPILICADPAFFCLCLGLLVVLVSINGALGFLRCHLVMLNFFAWILVLLFLTFFGAGVAFWIMAGKVMKIFKYASLAAVVHYNHGDGKGPTRWALSRMIDFTQSRLQCCGSDGFKDWTKSAIICVPKNSESDRNLLPSLPEFEPQRQLPSNPFDAFGPIPKKQSPTPLTPETFPSPAPITTTLASLTSSTKPMELPFTKQPAATTRQTLFMPPKTQPIMVKPKPEKDEVDKLEEEDLRTRFQPDKCRIPESCCAGGGFGGGYCGVNIIEKPYLTGCYEQVGNFFERKSAAIAAIWISLWAVMLLQIMAARFLIRRTRLERKFLKAYNRARGDWEQKQASFMEEEKELRSREMVLARNYPIQLASLQKCPSEVLKSNKDEDDNDNFDDERTIPVHPSQFPSINDVSRLVSQREEPRPQSILKKTFHEPDSEDEVGINYNLRPLE